MSTIQVKKIEGLHFSGEYTETTQGVTLPIYDIDVPQNGRPSINTAEGWNARGRESRRERLIEKLKREPTDEEIDLLYIADLRLAIELFGDEDPGLAARLSKTISEVQAEIQTR